MWGFYNTISKIIFIKNIILWCTNNLKEFLFLFSNLSYKKRTYLKRSNIFKLYYTAIDCLTLSKEKSTVINNLLFNIKYTIF